MHRQEQGNGLQIKEDFGKGGIQPGLGGGALE